MSIGIDFILRAKSAAFTQGLAAANNSLKDLKKSARDFDVGGGFKQALGVGGVIAGFRMAIQNAQELRDEAAKTGRAIDDSTRSVAEYGDALAKLFAGTKNAFTEGLSFFTRMGDAARRYFQDVTMEQERAAQKMVDTTAKAADEAEARLKKAREENSPEKIAAAQKQTADAWRESQYKGTEAEKKLVDLINKRVDLDEQAAKVGPKTVEAERIRAQIIENETAQKELQAQLTKDQQKETEKETEKKKDLINKFAPTVEELAKQETGGFVSGDDPRLKARRILKQEEQARALFERGDFKGGLAAATAAQTARKNLEDRTSENGALTPKAAEQAFATALETTNAKLDDLEKAVSGIIRAQ